MKISTINTIYWVAVAAFWALAIGDITTPGEAPKLLALVQDLSLFTLLSAHFYTWGTKRAAKNTNSYEMSN